MLPLDLHVLSLPLAFILSQDQTLHCNISFLKYLLKINPVSSKTQTKSLGFWRDLSRLCATTSSLIQRTFPLFIILGWQRYWTFSLYQTFFKSFFTFFIPPIFRGNSSSPICQSYSFREHAFLQKRVQRYAMILIKQIIAVFFILFFLPTSCLLYIIYVWQGAEGRQ